MSERKSFSASWISRRLIARAHRLRYRKASKMSAVSTSRTKKIDPLSKKIPENPKYKNVRRTIDTGASITKYMEKIEDIRNNYRFKKDEIFKRMKVTTFVQLVIQVEEYKQEVTTNCTDNGSVYRPDTADLEIARIQRGEGDRSPAPSLVVSEGDYGAAPPGTSRSTLQGVIRGTGELDRQDRRLEANKALDGCPYLLLDIREQDEYNRCHVISAKNYPIAMLSRAVNYESKDMLAYKNKAGKIILLYDEDERIGPQACTTLVQRGYDNIFLLSGGMKIAYRIFPEGLLTGTPPVTVRETPRPGSQALSPTGSVNEASKADFDQSELDNLSVYLDSALTDTSSSSRLSKASTRMSTTRPPTKPASRSTENQVTGRPIFKP